MKPFQLLSYDYSEGLAHGNSNKDLWKSNLG